MTWCKWYSLCRGLECLKGHFRPFSLIKERKWRAVYCIYVSVCVCTSLFVHVMSIWCDGGYSGADLDERSFYFWMQTRYRKHNMPPTEQDTCNQPLTLGHFKSLSPSFRAGANPCCVYHTTGTTAGWSVCSLSWPFWSADTYGYYLGWCALIWISTNGLQVGISACTVSFISADMKGSAQSGLNHSIAIANFTVPVKQRISEGLIRVFMLASGVLDTTKIW